MERKEYALAVCDHVAYEIKMFVFCIKELIERETKNIPKDNFHNALVESFAVHFRNLYAFFRHKEKKKCKGFNDNNVYYFDIKKNRCGLNGLSKDYIKACKGIAHIDRDRTELKQDGWNYCKLYRVFRTPILEFINDPEILPFITGIYLISEIREYCNFVDSKLSELRLKGLEVNKVDTTSGSVSITSSIIQVNDK